MPLLSSLAPSDTVDHLPVAARHALDAVISTSLGDVFPALALTVARRGDVLLNRAWGWIDPDTRLFPVTPSSRFDLASVTKLFTATTFLSLVSAGKVRLDQPLADIVPEFGESGARGIDGGQDPHSKVMLPTPDDLRGALIDPRHVTFRHLLTHTSGIAPWRDIYNAAGSAPVPPDALDSLSYRERWRAGMRAVYAAPFVGEPGDIVRYSDLGIMLLAEAIERLDGRPLDEAITARVSQPLGLTTVTFNPLQHGVDRNTIPPTEDDPMWRGRRAWGEVHDENACGLGGVSGHAGLFAAARDVAALGQAWLERDSRLSIDRPLMDEAVREHALTDGARRGLGWGLKFTEDASCGDLFGSESFGHTGFTGTSLWIEPVREIVVACMTNRVFLGREKEGIHEFRRAVHDLFAQIADGLFA